ncbi:MAG: VCBS repeat-containing protein, partial [Clostridia bacterium]|nr:VCBS repeat-containing protein [Clostridia bacterium]
MKAKILLLVAVMLFTLTGCAAFGGDVETQLRPPKAVGEQGRIEEALRDYIASTLTQENCVMKYPESGDYRSAFVVQDLDSDGSDEALAFYRLGAENSTTHINLLRKEGNKWHSVYDYESTASDIESVCFGDMDGDGMQELFVCWDMYSSRTYQLSLYMLGGGRVTERFTGTCAQVTVGDLTGDGRDDCLSFNMDADGLSATLWEMRDGVMEQRGHTVVDAVVQKLENVTVRPLSETENGVFLDYAKSVELMQTALIRWDGTRLLTPLYPNETDKGTQTLRPATVPSGDVDGDGVWEWPTCERLVGYENEEGNVLDSTQYKTTFWSWDATLGRPVEKLSCIYNEQDRYYLMMDERL